MALLRRRAPSAVTAAAAGAAPAVPAARVRLAPDPTAVRVRVLTLNLHKGFSALNRRFVLHEIREAVREVGADIVFLQEVLGASQHRATTPEGGAVTLPQYEFLADSIWHQHAYGRNAVSPTGHHGNALLSRFPIRAHRNVDVSRGTREARGLLHCEIEVPGLDVPLHAVCVHLGLLESHRQHQLDSMCALVDKEVPPDAPVVIAGDFNDWRLRGHRRMQGHPDLIDVHAHHAKGHPPRTFPARRPLLRLDRIYVRGAREHAPIALPRRPWSHLSDHTPLGAEVML